jgi:hypothetical protein
MVGVCLVQAEPEKQH